MTSARSFSVNWVVGSEEGRGWAYSNNAERLSDHMPRQRHEVNSAHPSDVAVFFDVLIASKARTKAKAKVLRIGGPRPLARLYADEEELKSGIAVFDAIVVLSHTLRDRIAECHPYVVFVPNGLDLSEWSPSSCIAKRNRRFTAGFAASLKSEEQKVVKGFNLFETACQRAGVESVYLEKGRSQLPHNRMIPDFYSQIDVLVHPSGQEGTSNVVMEALALGVPVVTTRDAGFHGERLKPNVEALICERDTGEIADALDRLRRDRSLRDLLSAEGRAFAIRNHDISIIAARYERVFRDCLARADARSSGQQDDKQGGTRRE